MEDDNDGTVFTVPASKRHCFYIGKSFLTSTTSEPRQTKRDSEVGILRVEGVGATCDVVPGTETPKIDEQNLEPIRGGGSPSKSTHDDDEQETVQVKSRCNRSRKKNELIQT